MIDITANKQGDLRVGQVDASPTVYLDHWALRTLSADDILGNRLVAALKSRNGTLAISWLNVGEFTKVTSVEQARKAERLVESCLPNVFFLEVEPFKVIEREDKLLAGGPLDAPHGDLELLKAFVLLRPESIQLLTASKLFQVVQGRELVQRLDGLAETVLDRVSGDSSHRTSPASIAASDRECTVKVPSHTSPCSRVGWNQPGTRSKTHGTTQLSTPPTAAISAIGARPADHAPRPPFLDIGPRRLSRPIPCRLGQRSATTAGSHTRSMTGSGCP